MTVDLTDALAWDVRDLLGTSAVGLYEFSWILRGMDSTMGLDAMREQASAALRQLLAEGQGHLVLLTWPSEDVVDAGAPVDVGPRSWEDPSLSEPYIAITRN